MVLREEPAMGVWAAIYFVIALVAAIVGFGGIVTGATAIAKVLFVIFVVAFVVSLVLSLFRI
jgi:uncharacterized membrane protein YtjA (UPF0391 family)